MLHGRWDLPGSVIEPVSLAWVRKFFTTEPLGKVPVSTFLKHKNLESNHILYYFELVNYYSVSAIKAFLNYGLGLTLCNKV